MTKWKLKPATNIRNEIVVILSFCLYKFNTTNSQQTARMRIWLQFDPMVYSHSMVPPNFDASKSLISLTSLKWEILWQTRDKPISSIFIFFFVIRWTNCREYPSNDKQYTYCIYFKLTKTFIIFFKLLWQVLEITTNLKKK